MKQESILRYTLRITLVLLTIAVVVAGLLAVVNRLTAPVIAQATQEKIQAAIGQVLPGGYEEEITEFTDETGLVSKVYRGEAGYALEVNPVGFDSAICMMVGIDNQGKVLGIAVVSHTETSGLGTVAAANNSAGQSFRDQFVGATGSVSVNKDGGQIDAITGATVTSRAVCAGVNAALQCVAELEGGK